MDRPPLEHSPSRRLLLFAKRPRLGRVKTRLVPPLDVRQALELYRAFLADQLRLLREFVDEATDVQLWVDGPWRPDGELADLAAGVPRFEQREGDLGRRLLHAFERAVQDGAATTVVIGSDSPTLPAALVERAFARLAEGHDAAVAPSPDGGYVLLGMRAAQPSLFREVPWGGSGVLAATRRQARAAGLRLAELDGWYDVDDARGLERLRRELRSEAAHRRAPATARLVARLRLR